MTVASLTHSAPVAQLPAHFTPGQFVRVRSGVHLFGGLIGTVKAYYIDCRMYAVALPRSAAPGVTAVNFEGFELEAVR